ncbi:MAG TPA: tRNA threonylcarbamoyladenosine dehydratase [Thiothrix sp.]|nr:tRNA threonylcarbamoyladenosine dehydratase [Thiothrix sp.]
MSIHERTHLLLGEETCQQLKNKHILIAGIGGVGSFAAEALIRAGIKQVSLLDHDTVSESNRNRQLLALASTVGQQKTAVMQARAKDINPAVTITALPYFITPDNAVDFVLQQHPQQNNTAAQPFDYVLDCIDSIACKAALVIACQQHKIPIISSMGAGGRLDPTQIHLTQLAKTENCGLAREMRKRLRKAGRSLNYPVVYSSEIARKGTGHLPIAEDENAQPRTTNGTISYLPALFGLTMAGHVVQALIN